MKELQELQEKVGEWAEENFGDRQTPEHTAKKLVEVAKDLLEAPYDVIKQADVLLVLLNLSRLSSNSAEDLIKAAEAKHIINISKIWEIDEEGLTRWVKPTNM